jgi:large subunit ribosomal protein L24
MKKIHIPSNKSKKIRKGDKVIAIAGNDRGKTGIVLACSGEKILVQGINVRKKHVKRSQQNQLGGIITMEKPIHVSNLKVCTADETPVKLKVRTTNNGERQLVYTDNDNEVLHRSLKKS